ncbi:MAG: ectoine hydroxylase-related dioxygenase (phytanoyl-CoA dioxygenase family) [Oceanospirillaceae bacterium]|jgi:ectoine hydroxylase-related dioxygenase (phytanoyl-CoA dioxygenase family)
MITAQQIEDYQTDGVVVLRGVFKDWINTLNEGADFNVANPSARSITHQSDKYKGRFFEDFSNWQNIAPFKQFVEQSPMADIGAQLMQSQQVQMFHDHYLDKAAVSGVATPWHQDMPYYFVDGMQTVSFWVPLDSRTEQVSLRCVAGSHLWPKLIMPTKWSGNAEFYPGDDNFMSLPDIDNSDYEIRSWAVEPGDVVAFNFKTVHGANANDVDSVNRTVSFRLVGDDARYVQRPGPTSPNYPDINQTSGERLREDWFPTLRS